MQMDQEVCYLSATELADGIRSKTLSPVEFVRAHMERIEALDPKLNAVVTLAYGAMDRAREAEDAAMRGELWGRSMGSPLQPRTRWTPRE